MPEKVNKKKEIKSNSDVYEIYLGTFNDDVFTWYSIKKMKDPTQAYKEFKKYVNTQLKYTDEELKKVWDTGRLDIELRQGNKLLNWVGIYSREVKELSKKEEKEAEEGKVKKSKTKKDSALTPTEIFLREYTDILVNDADVKSLSMEVGEEQILSPDVEGEYKFVSSKPEIVSVDEQGKIKALAKGNVVVTAIPLDGGEKETISIFVEEMEDAFYIDCKAIQFFINAKKGEKVPTREYDFENALQLMDLNRDEVTKIQADPAKLQSEDLDERLEEYKFAIRRFKDLGHYIVERYLPEHDFMFDDIDLKFGDTVAIKFVKPGILNKYHNEVKANLGNGLRFNYKKPYTKSEDLYLKTSGETSRQTINTQMRSPRLREFKLDFDITSNLRGYADKFIVWVHNNQKQSFVFDHILSEKEVRDFLSTFVTKLARIFNKYNNGDRINVNDTVDVKYTNIKMYRTDVMMKEYPDMEFEFEAKVDRLANTHDSAPQYFLSFDFANSLKGFAWAEEYIDWCGLDPITLYLDQIPTEQEVQDFFEETVMYFAEAFNENNTEYSEDVDCYFTDVQLYRLNENNEIEDYKDQLVKEYPNYQTSFKAIM